jgi:hypothetical protein
MKYPRRTTGAAVGNGMGTTPNYLRAAAGIGLGETVRYHRRKQRAQRRATVGRND